MWFGWLEPSARRMSSGPASMPRSRRQLAGDVLAKWRIALVVGVDGEVATLLCDGVPDALGERLGRDRIWIGIGDCEVVLRAVDDARLRGLRDTG